MMFWIKGFPEIGYVVVLIGEYIILNQKLGIHVRYMFSKMWIVSFIYLSFFCQHPVQVNPMGAHHLIKNVPCKPLDINNKLTCAPIIAVMSSSMIQTRVSISQ